MKQLQNITQAARRFTHANRRFMAHPKGMAIAIAAALSWVGGASLWTLEASWVLEICKAQQAAQRHQQPWTTSSSSSEAQPVASVWTEPRPLTVGALLALSDETVGELNESTPAPFVPPPPAAEVEAVAAGGLARSGSVERHAVERARPEWMFPELFRAEFPSLGSPRLDTQIRLYSAYLAAFGPPDVLIVGSSRALQGIDPATLQAELARQGHSDLQVYNFSVNGATAQVVDLIMRQMLRPDQLPSLVIWGDGSRAFNSGRTDATYSQIMASPGYQRLQQGDRPIPYKAFDTEAPLLCRGIADGSVTVAESGRMCDRTTLETSQLRRWERDRLTLQQRWVDQYGNGLNRLGFHTVTEVFEPSRYYQRYPRVPGAYDSNYVPFRLGGVQTNATVRLAQYLQAQGMPLVVVNLPLANDYLDSYRQQREAQFRQHMRQLARQHGFLWRDLSQVGLSRNSNFADPSHLNINGARAIATFLAQDATMPWPTDVHHQD